MISTISTDAKAQDTVVLLHGIGHSHWNMYWVERALQKEGYHTVNLTYPSLKKNVKSLSQFLNDQLTERSVWNAPGQVHFVTHSMGGLVTQQYLENYKSEIPAGKLGRVVMMGPPNGGSEIADLLKSFPPYQWGFGPAGQDLTTRARKDNKVTVYYDLGVIAGSKKWPYILANFIIPGDHDGRVSIENTKLDGMTDHIILPATHSFMSWKPSVHQQIIYFIRHGEFSHEQK